MRAPAITADNRAYWEGCAAGELRLQTCAACATARFPESPVCPRCLSAAATWRAARGRGRVWSWIRMHQVYFAELADQVPYVVLFVDLDEGPRMIAGLEGDAAGLAIGAAVEAVFVPLEDRIAPRFRMVG